MCGEGVVLSIDIPHLLVVAEGTYPSSFPWVFGSPDGGFNVIAIEYAYTVERHDTRVKVSQAYPISLSWQSLVELLTAIWLASFLGALFAKTRLHRREPLVSTKCTQDCLRLGLFPDPQVPRRCLVPV